MRKNRVSLTVTGEVMRRKVPLEESRSVRVAESPLSSIAACVPETKASREKRMSPWVRPRTMRGEQRWKTLPSE